MKTSLPSTLKSLSLAAPLLVLSVTLTGCGPEQEEQFSSVLSTSDYRSSQVAPHIHTAGAGGVYFLSNLPASNHRHPHQPKTPQLRHHAAQSTQLGPAAVN